MTRPNSSRPARLPSPLWGEGPGVRGGPTCKGRAPCETPADGPTGNGIAPRKTAPGDVPLQ